MSIANDLSPVHTQSRHRCVNHAHQPNNRINNEYLDRRRHHRYRIGVYSRQYIFIAAKCKSQIT